MSKHTPGPWEWRIKREILVDPKDKEFGFFVGDLKHPTGEKSGLLVITTEENRYGQKEIICFSEADRNLIAAAPEMLEALKLMVVSFDPEWEHQAFAIDKAEKAIAKAEGRE